MHWTVIYVVDSVIHCDLPNSLVFALVKSKNVQSSLKLILTWLMLVLWWGLPWRILLTVRNSLGTHSSYPLDSQLLRPALNILHFYSSLNLHLCDEYFCAICRRLKKLAMIYWRKYIPMMRSEREKDIRRAEMRKRVHSWLPDFQTLTESSP